MNDLTPTVGDVIDWAATDCPIVFEDGSGRDADCVTFCLPDSLCVPADPCVGCTASEIAAEIEGATVSIEVIEAPITAPTELAYTGADPLTSLLVGGSLIVAGFFFRFLSNNKERVQ